MLYYLEKFFNNTEKRIGDRESRKRKAMSQQKKEKQNTLYEGIEKFFGVLTTKPCGGGSGRGGHYNSYCCVCLLFIQRF